MLDAALGLADGARQKLSSVRTELLELHYIDAGPHDGPVALLLHGWPDDPHTWTAVSDRLNIAGWRTIAPYLRGFGPNRFLSAETPRTGQVTALASDALALADLLSLPKFTVIGHDWGARTAYALAAQAPSRVNSCIALSIGYGAAALSLPQAQQFWYQWFFAAPQGEAALRDDRRALAHHLWRLWSPSWQFDVEEFGRAAAAFDNPDWLSVTLHGYRHRWGLASGDPRYAEIESRLAGSPRITVSTLVLHGDDDQCLLPSHSLERERWFDGVYRRIGLPGVGHFPQREAAGAVADLILQWLHEPQQKPAAA